MICIDCVRPAPLKKLIVKNATLGRCKYCERVGRAVESSLLFDYLLARVSENTATTDELSQYEYGMYFDAKADNLSVEFFSVVLTEVLGLDDEPYCDDLFDYAPRSFKYDRGDVARLYVQDDGFLEKNNYEEKWAVFIDGIVHNHRFFNPNAHSFLDKVFSFLSSDADVLKPACIRTIPRGELLFRARSASSYEDAKRIADNPASQLGPTPKDRAGNQRMTPAGIPALYCALDRQSCLSEIRAITGDNVVSIAMTPTTRLELLDLTKLNLVEPPALTLLDEGYRDALHLRVFLASMVEKMSKPRGRNDDLSYLSTQVVFEYLRLRFGGQVSGLVFPSVQTGKRGTNVVLFPEASIVSEKNYVQFSDYEIAESNETDFMAEDDLEPFEDGARLYCVSGSLRFHKVQSIETISMDFTNCQELFMSPLDRKRYNEL